MAESTYTTAPRQVGDEYDIEWGNGVHEVRVVTGVEKSTIFGDDDEGWVQHTALVSREAGADPRTLSCAVCGAVIGEGDWQWAAMPSNGPVHLGCFMSDDELWAEYVADGEDGCVLHFADGVNNATIYPDGRVDRCSREPVN